MSTESLREVFARVKREKAEREAIVQAFIAQIGERPFSVVVPAHGIFTDDVTFYVHRDTHEKYLGQWRVTRFINGEPWGHYTHASYADVLRQVVGEYHADLHKAKLR
jgi:hypothetical protein